MARRGTQTYTVKTGDNAYGIAGKIYRDLYDGDIVLAQRHYDAVLAANGGGHFTAGTVLELPDFSKQVKALRERGQLHNISPGLQAAVTGQPLAQPIAGTNTFTPMVTTAPQQLPGTAPLTATGGTRDPNIGVSDTLQTSVTPVAPTAAPAPTELQEKMGRAQQIGFNQPAQVHPNLLRPAVGLPGPATRPAITRGRTPDTSNIYPVRQRTFSLPGGDDSRFMRPATTFGRGVPRSPVPQTELQERIGRANRINANQNPELSINDVLSRPPSAGLPGAYLRTNPRDRTIRQIGGGEGYPDLTLPTGRQSQLPRQVAPRPQIGGSAPAQPRSGGGGAPSGNSPGQAPSQTRPAQQFNVQAIPRRITPPQQLYPQSGRSFAGGGSRAIPGQRRGPLARQQSISLRGLVNWRGI